MERRRTEATTPAVRLRTLGPIELTCADPAAAARVVAQPKRLAVLAYLAARAPGEPVRRDRLLATFWPELPAARARAGLRNALHFLRRAVGAETLPGAGNAVRVAPERLTCDAADLIDDAPGLSPSELLDLYRGEFLDGLHVSDAPDFERWVDRMRAALRSRATALAWQLSERSEAAGEWITAARFARRAADLAVDVEGASQRLIRLLDRAGDRAAALAEYERLEAWLAAEFEVSPSPETAALVEGVRARSSGWPGAPAAGAPGPGGGRRFRSLAVLPFEDLGGGGGLAMGLVDDLLAALSTLRDVRVVSRTSVQRFAVDRPRSMREVRELLDVDLVLEGSVRVQGGLIRVTVQLIDAVKDSHVWAQTYDRRLTDVFEVQSDIALRIARALDVELSPQEHRRLRHGPTRNLEAYRLYLKGREVWSHRKPADASRAAQLFRRALAVDPRFTHAWVGLADAHLIRAHTAAGAFNDATREAKLAIDRALATDPDSGEATATRALILTFVDWDHPGAAVQYARAIELSPGYATAHQWYGQWLVAQGRIDEGLAAVDVALELDLLSPAVNEASGLALYHAGRIDEAAAQFHTTLDLDPEYSRARLGLALCDAARGEAGRAADALVKAWSAGAGGGDAREAGEAVRRLAAGYEPALEYLLECVRVRAPAIPFSRVLQIQLLTLLGRHAEAIDALEAALEERSLGFCLIHAPVLDPLASDVRFHAVLEAAGLMLPRWRGGTRRG